MNSVLAATCLPIANNAIGEFMRMTVAAPEGTIIRACVIGKKAPQFREAASPSSSADARKYNFAGTIAGR